MHQRYPPALQDHPCCFLFVPGRYPAHLAHVLYSGLDDALPPFHPPNIVPQQPSKPNHAQRGPVAAPRRSGRQVILVTSGSVGAGLQRIRREQILNSSPLELQGFNVSALRALPCPFDLASPTYLPAHLTCAESAPSHSFYIARMHPQRNESETARKEAHRRAAAACGQSGLMALYDLLFSHMDLACSQLLITRNDFLSSDFRAGLKQVRAPRCSMSAQEGPSAPTGLARAALPPWPCLPVDI